MFNNEINWEKVIAVTNRKMCGNNFFQQIKKIGSLGIKAIILREKDLSEEEYEQMAEKVLRICEKTDTPCILHSFPQAAVSLGCSRLHLPLSVWEKSVDLLSDHGGMQIGTSVHSVEQAVQAETLGAAYMSAGHIFVTDCKAGLAPRGIDFLRNICQTVQVPVYGIGGIHPDNMHQVLEAGAAGVCMMSEMMRL